MESALSNFYLTSKIFIFMNITNENLCSQFHVKHDLK